MSFQTLMAKGGYVMWPLLVMSLISLTLIFERAWFFARTNSTASRRQFARLTKLTRQGDLALTQEAALQEGSVYSDAARQLLSDDEPATESRATEVLEAQRQKLEPWYLHFSNH